MGVVKLVQDAPATRAWSIVKKSSNMLFVNKLNDGEKTLQLLLEILVLCHASLSNPCHHLLPTIHPRLSIIYHMLLLVIIKKKITFLEFQSFFLFHVDVEIFFRQNNCKQKLVFTMLILWYFTFLRVLFHYGKNYLCILTVWNKIFLQLVNFHVM